MKRNILVFPCGSEIALEIHRSLEYSIHFNLIGCNSVDDHGRFVYKNYIGNVPFINSEDFIPTIKSIVTLYKIDAIYPAMDETIAILKRHEKEIGCYVISSELYTVELCLSKRSTYNRLSSIIRTPKILVYNEIKDFPVFVKPNIGYGARGAKKINNQEELLAINGTNEDLLYCEYLPGEEYTVDCFTDRQGNLLFWHPRIRGRVQNGISVYTRPISSESKKEFQQIIELINENISFRGAWFAQLKRTAEGDLCLLEIASRFGGSSSLFRGIGVNFAQLTLFDAINFDVKILTNNYPVEMDRALDNIFSISIDYNEVFVDFDDCLLLERKYVNTTLIAFLYQCKNDSVKLSLLTKHDGDLFSLLDKFKLKQLFDRIIHVKKDEKKANFIDNQYAIFIDDSYSERLNVKEKLDLPVFSVDMIKCLLK